MPFHKKSHRTLGGGNIAKRKVRLRTCCPNFKSEDHSKKTSRNRRLFEYHELGVDWYHFALICSSSLEASALTLTILSFSYFFRVT